MLRIRQEHLNALEQSAESRQREDFMKRLREDCPNETSNLSDPDLRAHVDQGTYAAQKLLISEPRDVYRFLKLRYLPKEALEAEPVRNAFYRTLTDLEIDATERLDFIERNIIDRHRADPTS